ncbi:MAG: twitching motility two-component system response regulator [Candidatus Scalindua rubra]|uniref:Twitching motility two-component system response regulator n=1 Tax=Candidatus Scalindua rubra TaxID=1872076 RepID=A0A1E3XF33_9BACT|nr:MAG: twitching motility two-component system response regulator [Candidatus Scalindua rubra]
MVETLQTNICPPKIKELIDITLSKLNSDCTNLIGRNLGISKPNFKIVTLEEFFANNDGKFFLIKSELGDSYEGNICTILQLKDVIKIGGALLGSEDNQIKEKIEKEDLDEEYTDGIQEFGNQLSGMIDATFRAKLPKSVHVKLSLCTPINKDNVKDIFENLPNEEYLHLSSMLLIKGFETGNFNMFFSIEIAEEFFGEKLQEKNTNVLVTDDSPIDIKIIKKYLTNTEFNVLTAHNASETLTMLQKEKVHLILLDLIMPDHNGIEVCKKIKKTPYTRGIPIVMISAKPTEAAVVEALESGVRDFLVKPFSKERLLQKINRYKVKKKAASLF